MSIAAVGGWHALQGRGSDARVTTPFASLRDVPPDRPAKMPALILAILALAGPAAAAPGPPAPAAVLASLRLYNPTAWAGPVPIEVPVGKLAAPGLIDWARVRLVTGDGKDVPFALHEGRPHGKARLTAPVATPRAEDLLVFSCPVPPGRWVRLDLVDGSQGAGSVLAPTDRTSSEKDDDRLVVSYPDLQVTVDRATGLLVGISAFGKPVLDGPLAMTFVKTAGDKGAKQPLGPPKARLVSRSTTAAMTELNFLIEPAGGPAMALSYRIHSCGPVEIWSDERPWQGVSPWVDHALEISLPLGEKAEPLTYLVNRAPFYGFKDYAAAVRHVAAIHRRGGTALLELGEETVNGRRWNRRLYPIRQEDAAKAGDAVELAELADKGLIVQVAPHTLLLSVKEVKIAFPAGAHVPARTIADALEKRGVRAKPVPADAQTADAAIALGLVGPQEAPGIEGDGFDIRLGHRFALPQPPSGASGGTGVSPGGTGVSPVPGSPTAPQRAAVRVTACTRFGLMQAALRIAEHLARPGQPLSLPLIAQNPAVRIRGAGFGGGDFEVDFPHGSDAEWEQAFDQFIAGGMNVMTDLGMWSNWKMPVAFRGMPELRSDSPDAFDELSGAKLAEFAPHREHGQKLLSYLHDRGVKVWLWLPVGCVPTTYAQKHPEAMAPKSDRCPCFTHPVYDRFLKTFLGELLESYPIDGVVMIRDDNGGLCPCPRCREYVASSRTRSAAWEQYLVLYRWLRKAGFAGDVAVYPYFDLYEPRLDPLLPADLLIVGHGSGAAVLVRNYDVLAPMGDTWLDNLFASFRVPTAARMKRLLADRNSFWLGGALVGCELPWQAIGRFGFEPTATVNSLRHEWGVRQLGPDRALDFVALAGDYEQLWEIYDLPMLPQQWVKLGAEDRRETGVLARRHLGQFRRRLAALEKGAGPEAQAAWFRHLDLFATYFEYHLRRLEILSRTCELVAENKRALDAPAGLPAGLREQLLAMHREVYELAEGYDRQAAAVPGAMMARTRALGLTQPFKEFVAGYDPSLDGLLPAAQFAGSMAVSPAELAAGRPFVLRVRLQNAGVCPWIPGVGHRLEIRGEVQRLGLTDPGDFLGPPMVFGDRREIELRGTAPQQPGEVKIELVFLAPFRNVHPFLRQEVTLKWR